MREFTPGDVFADHRIDALAGRGGMGVVYRATQLGLERTVALKVINPGLADDEDFRRRFVAESKAAASVEHPNVLPVHYAGEHDGVLFIVMRYVDGPDLRGSSVPKGAWIPSGPRTSWRRSAGRSTPPTATASCTATSSRPTSCSARTTTPT